MRPAAAPARLGLAMAGALAATAAVAGGCERFGPVTDLDGRRPENGQPALHVSWTIDRSPSYERISCGAANAGRVQVVVDGSGPPHTYRMACDLPGGEAFVPVGRGGSTMRAELHDARGRILSVTRDVRIEIASATDERMLPLLFSVK